MRTYKNFLPISLFFIILILSVGIYLKFANQETGGFTYSKTGNAGTLSLNGNNIIFIGVIILILWFLFFITRNTDNWKSTYEDNTILQDLIEKKRREKEHREKKRRENKSRKNKR